MRNFTSQALAGMALVMGVLPVAATAGVPAKRAQSENLTPRYSAQTRVIPADPASETWKEIGEGILRDDVVTSYYIIDNEQFPVRLQESEQQPGRYRMVNAYHNFTVLHSLYPEGMVYPEDKEVTIVVDATDPDHVFMECGLIGTYIGGDAAVPQDGFLWSKAGDYMTENIGSLDYEDFLRVCGRLRNGAITFPVNGLLFQAYEGALDSEGNPKVGDDWVVVNNNGMFRLMLPGAPMVDMNIDLLGVTDDLQSVRYSFKLDKDIDHALATLILGNDVATAVEQIISGETDCVTITSDGVYEFPYDGDGLYTLVAVPYTADGTACYETTLSRTFDYDQSEWTKVGKATYTEGVLSANEMNDWGFIISSQTYDVQIEQNRQRPGLIRMVDPYGPGYAYATANNYDTSRKFYIEIDANDQQHVFLNETTDYIGLDLGYGPLAIWSKASRKLDESFDGMTIDEVIAEEEKTGEKVFGWVEDNTVRFPVNSLLLKFPFVRPDTWYWANRNGSFALRLPKDLLPNGVGETFVSDTNAPAEYYTLDGMKVDSSALTEGIYIVRKGSKAWKEVVRR